MSINNSELSDIAGSDPGTLLQQNFEVLDRDLYHLEPSHQSNVATTIKGPPTGGTFTLNCLWRDALGGVFVCTVAGTPGTWVQISPAVVSANPTGIPTGYWILRSDQNYKHYTYTGTGFAELYLSLTGGTMTGSLILASDPTTSLQAATKSYVDALAGGGADPKDSCRAASTANIDLTTGGLLTIDGVALNSGDRVLVMNQTAGAENGIYQAASGSWSRGSDSDTSSKVTSGMYCFVTEGTTKGDTGYVLTTNDPITLGTTALTFAQFSKGLADGECTDAKIGNRTVNQALSSPVNTGDLTSLLSWLAGRIVASTGTTNWYDTPQTTLAHAAEVVVPIVIDDGNASLATGDKRPIEISFAATVTGWTIIGNTSGSVTVALKKDTYTNYPPSTDMTNGNYPTLSSAQKNQNLSLSGWTTTTINAGDIIVPSVVSVSGLAWCVLSLRIRKT